MLDMSQNKESACYFIQRVLVQEFQLYSYIIYLILLFFLFNSLFSGLRKPYSWDSVRVSWASTELIGKGPL